MFNVNQFLFSLINGNVIEPPQCCESPGNADLKLRFLVLGDRRVGKSRLLECFARRDEQNESVGTRNYVRNIWLNDGLEFELTFIEPYSFNRYYIFFLENYLFIYITN